MNPTCRLVRILARTHTASCLSCQAELARYGKLRRRLAAMAEEVVPAPGPIAAAVAAEIATDAPPQSVKTMASPGAVIAAASAVTAAAAGAVVVAVWRRTHPALR